MDGTGAKDSTQLLAELTAIAAAASAAIIGLGVAARAARMKADDSPVTAADEAAEVIICERLARVAPGIPIVAEEGGGGGSANGLGDSFFLVDPLDGTRDFAAGRDEYTVNIALVRAGVPVLGVVAAPAVGLAWRGIVGIGAERLRFDPVAGAVTTEVTAIRTRRWPLEGVSIAQSRSHLDDATKAFVANLPVREQVACGSSIKFCRVAEGVADLYPRLAPTREWDIAAGQAVLEAAGGRVTNPDGTPLVYGKSGHGVPAFLAWGDPAAIERVLHRRA
jgi:3'(2'), 5'-bisphosphate nucleotidase